MKCPHCQVMFTEGWSYRSLGRDSAGEWRLATTQCANDECALWIAELIQLHPEGGQPVAKRVILPNAASRPVPPEVTEPYGSDFGEAAVVLSDSAKASAALSRRCLQSLLRGEAGVTHSNLNNEIDEVLSSGQLPSWLGDNLDAVRTVGNFAAHPIKSTNTGEVVDVEPAEAEWLLDVLEGLFDFYFVQPAAAKKKRDALNQKLQAANKPALKGTPGP